MGLPPSRTEVIVTHDEIIALLHRMDSGDLDFWCESRGWNDTYCGDVTFVTAEGHLVVVFNDCGDWDYVDSIYNPSRVKIWDFPVALVTRADDDRIVNWTPKHMSRWETSRVKQLAPPT